MAEPGRHPTAQLGSLSTALGFGVTAAAHAMDTGVTLEYSYTRASLNTFRINLTAGKQLTPDLVTPPPPYSPLHCCAAAATSHADQAGQVNADPPKYFVNWPAVGSDQPKPPPVPAPGFPTYSCEAGQCVKNATGAWSSADCSGKCSAPGPPPPKVEHYSCAPETARCVKDATGPWVTADCEFKCKKGPPPPPPRPGPEPEPEPLPPSPPFPKNPQGGVCRGMFLFRVAGIHIWPP
jgi:hypothetical protein